MIGASTSLPPLHRARRLAAISLSIVFVVVLATHKRQVDKEETWIGRTFPNSCRSSNFLLCGNTNDDMARLATIAETSKAVAVGMFCEPGTSPPQALLRIFVCAGPEDVTRLEAHYDVAPYAAATDHGQTAGGYYHDVPMIAVSTSPGRIEEVISHEVAHFVLEHLITSCPALLNEGAAMYVSERVLARDPSLDRAHAVFIRRWGRVCGRTELRENGVRDLLRVVSPKPGKRSYDDSFYAVAWCVIRAMVHHDGKEESRMPRLVEELAAGVDACEAIESLYGIQVLEWEARGEMRRLSAERSRSER